ncbi:MAG: kelch repeat-containing protein [Anaerolineae bacterium]
MRQTRRMATIIRALRTILLFSLIVSSLLVCPLATTAEPGKSAFTNTVHLPDQITFTSTGSLKASRFSHTATLLEDGRVLVAGGNNSAGAELYDPTTGEWTTTGSMRVARNGHTATMLPNGKVLVTGGIGGVAAIASAELFDPNTGTWSLTTDELSGARYDHTAILLPNGLVLIAGGYSGFSTLASAELYDPAADTFTDIPAMHFPRWSPTATLLADGQVLLAGGSGGGASAELYDSAANSWTLTGSMNTGRFDHTATLLRDGRVLVAGGYGGAYLASAELYNPTYGTWSSTGSLNVARNGHTAILLANGKVLVVGGYWGSLLDSTELYDPAADAWSVTGDTNLAHYGHTATLLNDDEVLIAGGQDGGFLNSVELSVFVPGNSFTGTLFLPSGWLSATVLSTQFVGESSAATITAGALSDNGATWGGWISITPGITLTTNWSVAGEGANQLVFLRLRDTNDRMATVVSGTVNVDLTKPASALTPLPAISPAAIPLSWSGADALSGIATYDVQVRDGLGGAWSDVITATSGLTTTYTGADGTILYFRVRARDEAGNLEDWPPDYDTFTLVDSEAPTGTVQIDEGTAYTVRTEVTLTLSASDLGSGVSQMSLSNDGNDWSEWQPFTTTTSWSLTVGDGSKTVYARYKDFTDKISAPVTDTIVLDSTPPASSISGLSTFQTSTAFTITWTGMDALTGIASYDVEAREGSGGSWYSILSNTIVTHTTFTGTHGSTYYFRLRAQDIAGNLEDWPSGSGYDTSTTIDLDAPSGSVVINDGITNTNRASVTLTLSAVDPGSGVAQMSFSYNGSLWGTWQSFTFTTPITLETGDGIKTVYVRYQDNAGNICIPVTDSIVLDTTRPTSVMNPLNTYQTSEIVPLSWSGTDALSGITTFDVQVRAGLAGVWTDVISGTAITSTSYVGLDNVIYYFRVRARDAADNLEDWPSDPDYNTVTMIDINSPSGTVVINGGDTNTGDPEVTLTLSASDLSSAVAQMSVSNDGLQWNEWQTFTTTTGWSLTTSDGNKTVYVRFKDSAGNSSSPTTDTIVLDTMPPTSSMFALNAILTTTAINIAWSGWDETSGVATYDVEVRLGVTGTWASILSDTVLTSTSYTGANGIPTYFRVRAKDLTGNVEDWPLDYDTSTIVDIEAPQGTIMINGGAAWVTSTSVTLLLDAIDATSGLSQMSFSNDGSDWSGWQAYAGTATWSLSPSEGYKVVYVRYQDVVGNISTGISDTITLDTVAPTGSLVIADGAIYITQTIVSLTIAANDATSGVSKMCFSLDGMSWSAWFTYTTRAEWWLTPENGTKTVYMRFQDMAGNISGIFTDTIILDTVGPTGTVAIAGGVDFINTTNAILDLHADDAFSPVTLVRLSNDGSSWSSWIGYSANQVWTLIAGEGDKTVYVQYKDAAGNPSGIVTDSIILDLTPPTASVNELNTYQGSGAFTITWVGSDSLSGVDSFDIQVRAGLGGTWTDLLSNTISTSTTYTGTDGVTYYYRVRAYDTAGNQEAWPESPDYDTFTIVDATAPSGTILINGGASNTRLTEIELSLSASDLGSGISQMSFSNDGSDWSEWQAFTTTTSWSLASGDDTKMVYTRFKDNVDNISDPVTDTIVLDTTPPASEMDALDPYQSSQVITITWAGMDALSGVAAFDVQVRAGLDGDWTDVISNTTITSTSYAGINGVTYYFRVRAKDLVGNLENWPSGLGFNTSTMIDTDIPTGTVMINDGAASINSTDVSLSISAFDIGSGVTQMAFSNDGSEWSGWQTYTETTTWSLTTGDGNKTVYVRFMDRAGNTSVPTTETIVLDTIPPTSSMDELSAIVTTTTFILTWEGTDESSGITTYDLQARSGLTGTWTLVLSDTVLTSTTYVGENGIPCYFRVRASDAAGNVEDWPLDYDATTIVDNEGPVGTVMISGGTDWITSTEVSLSLTAIDATSGVSQMSVSNDGSDWSEWQAFTDTITWSVTSGDGDKIVYVRYQDAVGNIASGVSDTITLDTVAPFGSLLIAGGAMYSAQTNVSLTVTADDATSGVSQMRFSDDGINWSEWLSYSTLAGITVTPSNDTKTVYVLFKDRAGNESALYTDTIILDTVAPTGTLAIASGAAIISSTNLVLDLNANDATSGVAQMRFSNNGSNWSAWVSYSITQLWTLSSGDGSKLVYGQYRDNAGNISAPVTDTILLDTTPPIASVDSLNAYQASTTFTITWSGMDTTSGGISRYDVQVRVGTEAEWTDLISDSTVTTTLYTGVHGATYYFRARATDLMGNEGSWPLNSIYDTFTVVDTETPSGDVLVNAGALSSTSINVTLTLSATDTFTVAMMSFSNDGVTWSNWQPYAVRAGWSLLSGEGLKTVYARFQDGAGNVSAAALDTITLDTSVGSSFGILINGGASYTNKTAVTLTLSAMPGTAQMQVSNDAGFAGALWEPYSSFRAWEITSPGSYLIPRTVYVRYRIIDAVDSNTRSDSILLDVTPPWGTVRFLNNSWIGVHATDDVSGVGHMLLSSQPDFAGASWEPYATIRPWDIATFPMVYIRFQDNAGNVSETFYVDSWIVYLPFAKR